MSLKQSNPYLKSASVRKAALRVTAKTSSAVEGIHAPFAKDKSADLPADAEAFTAYWKRRIVAIHRGVNVGDIPALPAPRQWAEIQRR